MPMVALSDGTRRRLVALLNERNIPEAERLLREACADVPLLGRPATAKSLERIRFAALRVSGGDLPRLRDAIALAQVRQPGSTRWRRAISECCTPSAA